CQQHGNRPQRTF
nr:immunoglobulin light chain junction region [Macaca mulatta]MPN99587.1 immunoglobulin light chain junction region [Macaca mulatta]